MLQRFFPSLLVLIALASPGFAQAGKVFMRYNGPLKNVRLDLETGTLVRGPVTSPRAQGTVAEFSNLDLSGFIAVDTGSCFCQWIDAGTKGHSGNASDLMSQLVLPYCSSALDPSSGGPGGSIGLGFYEGYTTGAATPSTTVAAFTVAGLPANTGSSSFFGSFQCYFMTIDLAALVCFADGQIGYSWKFLDGTGPATLAQTWPFLACVQSCSGIQDQGGVGGPNNMDLYIDMYCPPGFLRCSSFCFGSAPTTPPGSPFYLSLAIELREAADCVATVAPSSGQGLNLDVVTAPPAIVGENWSASVTLAEPSHPANGVALLLFSPDALATGPRVSVFGGPVTELLIGPATLSQPCSLASYSAGLANLCGGVMIPKEVALIGNEWNVQVLTGTPAAGMTFSNALGGQVGTE